MCLLFKSMFNGHFGTLMGADSPLAVELHPAEVWKPRSCKKIKWLPEFWFLGQKIKVTHFCESLEECKNWDLSDKNWASYGYFSFLPILAIDNWGNGRDIFVGEVAKSNDIFLKFFPHISSKHPHWSIWWSFQSLLVSLQSSIAPKLRVGWISSPPQT